MGVMHVRCALSSKIHVRATATKTSAARNTNQRPRVCATDGAQTTDATGQKRMGFATTSAGDGIEWLRALCASAHSRYTIEYSSHMCVKSKDNRNYSIGSGERVYSLECR